ncbi:MAG: hypothetical protein JSS38_19405 [Nitrospira sp.]|nr:hypothetical protein [Nitrospira sp.]
MITLKNRVPWASMAAIPTLSGPCLWRPLMLTRSILLLIFMAFMASCGGGDRHLPSSNPSEYDPKKIYTTPAVPPSTPATVATPTEFERLKAQLDSLEAGQKAKSEGKKIPFDPNLLQLLKGVTHPCEALSKLAPGLGSAQLFAGADGAALKKALGPDADGIARRMVEQLVEGLKPSLGPGAADCPVSVRPQKKSDLSQSPRLVLARTTPSQPLLLAQTTIPDASQDDYEVVSESSIPGTVPPDWVGWKTTQSMTRVGKEDRPTKGIREDYEMVTAPKAKRCPRLEGPDLKGMVDGTFEWSFMMFRATPGPQSVLYRQKVQVTLNGEVGDDAQLKKTVKFDATVMLQHIGSELPYYSQTLGAQGEFSFDQATGIPQEFKIITVSGFSEGEAQARDARLIGTLMALTAYYSGQTYVKAQREWNQPNTCVEIIFTPSTKTKKFVPRESTPVKTGLRTKKEQATVPAQFKEAKERPREGNGRVSPREDKSDLNTPATFTYQAPATKVQHSGFWVSAKSRAGVAEAKDGEWELTPSAYVLEFKSHIVQEPLNVVNPQFGMQMSSNGFDAHAEAMVPLRHRDDGEWVGEGAMQYTTRTMTQPAQCEIRIQGSGTTTFHVNGGSISLDPDPFAVKLIILPGQTEEVAETHCSSANTPRKLRELLESQGSQIGDAHVVSKGGGWRATFNLTRFRTFIWTPGRQGYEIGGWTPVRDSEVIAKKTITVNCGLGANTCREETTLTLRLAEEPGVNAPPQ